MVAGQSYAVAYTFDPAGNILTETYPSGRIVTYTRDALGRISGITTKQTSGSSPVAVASGVAYEPFGSLSGLTYDNGAVATLTYDQDYRLTGIAAAAGATTVQNLTNGFDAAGNITSITDALTPARTQIVTYDNLNRVATASGAYGAQSYTYDGVGNRLTRVLGATTETYVYAPTANQVATITAGTNVRGFTYANSGQVTEDVRDPTHTFTFVPNDNGRNSSAALNASTVGTYLYNAFEQRAQKVAGGATTQFVYDQAGHLLVEANASGVTQKEYIWLDDVPVAMVDSTGTPTLYFIHTDQLGTPQKITNTAVAVVWDGQFDPFGNPVSGSGGANWGSVNWGSFNWGATGPSLSLTNLRFPGQYFDGESSLNQNWNRDYDRSVGRYLQSDPVGFEGGWNTYAYVRSRPLLLADPEGDQGIPGALIGGVIDIGYQVAHNLHKNGNNLGQAVACINVIEVISSSAGGAALSKRD